jgi:hypothetical protein
MDIQLKNNPDTLESKFLPVFLSEVRYLAPYQVVMTSLEPYLMDGSRSHWYTTHGSPKRGYNRNGKYPIGRSIPRSLC